VQASLHRVHHGVVRRQPVLVLSAADHLGAPGSLVDDGEAADDVVVELCRAGLDRAQLAQRDHAPDRQEPITAPIRPTACCE
jgi:hypothetical protein